MHIFPLLGWIKTKWYFLSLGKSRKFLTNDDVSLCLKRRFLFTWAQKSHNGLRPILSDIFPRVTDNRPWPGAGPDIGIMCVAHQPRGLMMSAGHSNRSICTTNECWFQLSLINVWLECCYAARLIISDCTLSCLCLMVEEQITEGSLSGSWWPAPVTDWDQWSWQRRASGGTLHNRQQEPPHRAHRATPSHRRHYRVTQSPQSLLLTLLSSQCLIVSPLAWN